MIRQIHIQNYKALRDVTLDLTPFHVLIGPNDSGKTSILEAIQAFCKSADNSPEGLQPDKWFVCPWEGKSLVWNGNPDSEVRFSAMLEGINHECHLRFILPATGTVTNVSARIGNEPEHRFLSAKWTEVILRLRGSRYFRFQPRRLSLPAARDLNRRFHMEPSGFGLPICLEDILTKDLDRYRNLREQFKKIFPQIKDIKLDPVMASVVEPDVIVQGHHPSHKEGKAIQFEFTNSANLVPAWQVSDGILLVLAYLTILHIPQPPPVILVEEPETGIYPKVLRDVIRILRDLVAEQNKTQVIMTTHSPYVLDEFRPEEVTLCRKEPDGSISIHPLSKSEVVKNQIDIFSLGEIWTGESEEKLAETEAPAEEPAK